MLCLFSSRNVLFLQIISLKLIINYYCLLMIWSVEYLLVKQKVSLINISHLCAYCSENNKQKLIHATFVGPDVFKSKTSFAYAHMF